jgi:hypothetical protein
MEKQGSLNRGALIKCVYYTYLMWLEQLHITQGRTLMLRKIYGPCGAASKSELVAIRSKRDKIEMSYTKQV